MTPNKLLPEIPTTKEKILLYAQDIVQNIMDGHTTPQDAYLLYKSLEKFCETLKPELNKLVLAEAEKYGKEGFTHKGLKISFGEFGTRYDYAACKDEVWNQLKQDLSDRETFLKALKEPHTYVDESTGEAITIYPPVKTSTTAPTGSFK